MAERDPLPLRFGRESDPGKVREKNEDDFGYFVGGDRRLLVVADGMGGEAGGQEASRTAVATARRLFEAEDGTTRPVRDLLEATVAEANAALLARQDVVPELKGMGTTLELLLIEGDRVSWAHVGDSRVYRVRGGVAERLTKDHTRVQQMLEGGLLSPEEAAEHPQRNVLSRAVGRAGNLSPDVVVDEPILDGDSFLLCSDGLCDLVKDDEIAWFVDRCEPQDACHRLVRLALDRGGHDNTTVLVAYKGRPKSVWKRASTLIVLPPGAPVRRVRSRKIAVRAVGLLAVVLIGAWAWLSYFSGSGPGPERTTATRKALDKREREKAAAAKDAARKAGAKKTPSPVPEAVPEASPAAPGRNAKRK